MPPETVGFVVSGNVMVRAERKRACCETFEVAEVSQIVR